MRFQIHFHRAGLLFTPILQIRNRELNGFRSTQLARDVLSVCACGAATRMSLCAGMCPSTLLCAFVCVELM
jgi:hypothetical protein